MFGADNLLDEQYKMQHIVSSKHYNLRLKLNDFE